MPTDQNGYNSRITDETLEKKFRDSFRSQGGAELVDDLYASGVIVPIIDFSDAALGSVLRQDLQTAWDFATTYSGLNGAATANIVTTTGFWQVDLTTSYNSGHASAPRIYLSDGSSTATVWSGSALGSGSGAAIGFEAKFVVFLRSGDTLVAQSYTSQSLDTWVRQIADISGNITNPSGFTSS